jgi:RNA polymerase sigma-70 factor (ECF subfamily)
MESGPQISQQAPEALDPEALARGDRGAREAFCQELLEPVYAFVYWRVDGVAQDAEDVTQETFVTALATLDRFEGRSSLYTWVCGIAKNLARERVRARNRPRPEGAPDDLAASPSASPEALLEQAQTARLVGLALTELSPHYQRALLDKYVDHRSFAEMAAASRSTPKAVESTVQRAKRALAEGLARLGLRRSAGGTHE